MVRPVQVAVAEAVYENNALSLNTALIIHQLKWLQHTQPEGVVRIGDALMHGQARSNLVVTHQVIEVSLKLFNQIL